MVALTLCLSVLMVLDCGFSMLIVLHMPIVISFGGLLGFI